MPPDRVPASSEPRPENPWRGVDGEEWSAECWAAGFAAGRAAFDAVVAERDEAVKERDAVVAVCAAKIRERDEALAAFEKIADDERERIVAKLRFFGFPVAATMVEGDA